MDKQSKCCNVSVIIGGDNNESTHYYVCSKCGKACDLVCMDIREQIEQCSARNFDDLYEDPNSESVADDILELPDIKEALSLLELKRQGKLVKLADDQNLPSLENNIGEATKNGYCLCQLDFISKGFKRVETL